MATSHHTPKVNPATWETFGTENATTQPFADGKLSLPAMVAYAAILNNKHIPTYCAERGKVRNLMLALFELHNHGHISVMWEKVYGEKSLEELS